MRNHETAAIRAEALREHATHIEQSGVDPVLWRDLDRGRDVRVSTLAWDAAGRYAEEARHGGENDCLSDPRVQPDSYVVYPSCYDQMGNSDRDMFCLSVTNGHAWGWSIRQHGFTGQRAMNRKGEWIYESRGSGHNKARRWSLHEALSIALKHVDTHRINGSTAADCAARWPREDDPSIPPATTPTGDADA